MMANEKRLIDANAAVEFLRSLGNRDYRREKGTISDAIKMLSHPAYTPTVDAVEVVRCKDCKHWNEGIHWCDQHSHFDDDEWNMFSPVDFCSYGERKDNGC